MHYVWLSSSEFSDESSGTSLAEESWTVNLKRNNKNEPFWSNCPPALSRIKSHNILRGLPGPVLSSDISTPLNAFDLFINSTIVDKVTQCSILEGQRIAATKQTQLKKNDKPELIAFIWLYAASRCRKNWNVSVRELFGDPFQNPIYRA